MEIVYARVWEYDWECPECGALNQREGEPPMYGSPDECDACGLEVEVRE